MRLGMVLFVTVCMVLFGVAAPSYAEMAPQKVVDYANAKLAGLGHITLLIEAVQAENAKGKTLEEIQALDEEWKAEKGVAEFMKPFMEGACAESLQTITAADEAIFEIFMMDNQGANVCQTDKTGDYWQGDEAKFKESFADGKGMVFVDEVEYDDGLKANICQVSVPVMDGGQAIGAMTIGVLVDKVK